MVVPTVVSKNRREFKFSKLRSRPGGLKKSDNVENDTKEKATDRGASKSKYDPRRSLTRRSDEKKQLSKFTTSTRSVKIPPEKPEPSSSRRIQPNATYRKSNLTKNLDRKMGEDRMLLKKDNQTKSKVNQGMNRKDTSSQRLRKFPVLSVKSILCKPKTKLAQVQTSCLIETFAKSCQTMRQSQIDIQNSKALFDSLLEKIKTNKWGYEFVFVSFQTAAETSHMKSLKINRVKKPSRTIAKAMREIEHFDDLFKLNETCFCKYETKELLEILAWLLNDTRFHVKGTINVEEVADIMFSIDESRMDILPVALFQVSFQRESPHLIEWSLLRKGANRAIQCYVFISPTKVYKYLRSGFSKKASKKYVAFENHIPFLENEPDNFLIWDLWRTGKEEELIVVAVVDLVDNTDFYQEDVCEDQKIYKVANPAALLIKYVLLYSQKQYLTYKAKSRKEEINFKTFNVPMKFTFWISLFSTVLISAFLFCSLAQSGNKEVDEEKKISFVSVLLEALMQV